MFRVAALLSVTLLARVAHADDAEKLYNDGQAAYDAKRYDDAIAAWGKAYEASRLPALIFNLAQAHRLAGHCAKAVEAYKKFLSLDPSSDERPSAEQFMRELEPCPAPAPRTVTPPEQKPVIRIEDRGAGRRRAGLIVGGAGLAVFATGLYFGNQASSIANEIETACEMGCEWAPLADRDATGRRAQTLQYVFYAIGAAGLVGGTSLYLLGRSARETRVIVSTPPGGATVGVAGSF